MRGGGVCARRRAGEGKVVARCGHCAWGQVEQREGGVGAVERTTQGGG